MSKPRGDIDTTAITGRNYLNGKDSGSSFQNYCDDLRTITGARYVAFLHYDFGKNTVCVKAIARASPRPEDTDRGDGFGISGEEWEIDPDKFSEAEEGLRRHENLYSFCRGILSRSTAEQIESQFEFGYVYSHRIPRRGDTTGEFVVVMPRWETIAMPAAVSIFTDYIGMLLRWAHLDEKLIQSEGRYRLLAETAREFILSHDCTGKITYVNAAGAEMIGLHPARIVGRNLLDFICPEYHKRLRDVRNRRVNCGDQSPLTYEIELLNRFSQRIPLEINSTPQINGGNCSGSMVIGRDISTRKKIETALRLRSAALEAAGLGVMITDNNGIVEWVNPEFTKITGYAPVEIIGKTPKILAAEGHNGVCDRSIKDLEVVWAAVRTGSVWRGELECRRKDGARFSTHLVVAPVFDDQNEISHIVAIKQDITEQKQLLEKIHHMDRMEGIGRMASGISHDFNNILGIILGYATLIEQHAEKGSGIARHAGIINTMVDRGAKLAQQVLTFARRKTVPAESVCLNTFIDEIADLLRETFPKNIEVCISHAPSLPAVMIDKGQLHQVLLNLAVNARDAIVLKKEARGAIRIETDLVRDSCPNGGDGGPIRQYAVIRMSDTGVGMDKETLGKIYDPFFTTKGEDGGSGLGLSVVYGIVGSHNGFIDVESTPGVGSAFSVFLPVTSAESVALGRQDEGELSSLAGTETVLVVEDEVMMLHILTNILKRNGYTVISAGDGKEAYEIYEKNKGLVDIVVSDHGLPELSGFDMYKQIALRHGKVPFIMVSGYISNTDRSQMLNAGVSAIIQKPFRPEAVLSTIRSLLDAPDGKPKEL